MLPETWRVACRSSNAPRHARACQHSTSRMRRQDSSAVALNVPSDLVRRHRRPGVCRRAFRPGTAALVHGSVAVRRRAASVRPLVRPHGNLPAQSHPTSARGNTPYPNCLRRLSATPSMHPRHLGRTIHRHEHQALLDRARQQARSAARRDRQRRQHLAEVSFADATNITASNAPAGDHSGACRFRIG